MDKKVENTNTNYIFHFFLTELALVVRWTVTCDCWSHLISFACQFAAVDTGSVVIQAIRYAIWT